MNVAETEGKTVRVVPSKSVPARYQRAAGAQPARRPGPQRRRHDRAPGQCADGRVTVAVQDVDFDGIQVRAGD